MFAEYFAKMFYEHVDKSVAANEALQRAIVYKDF